MFLTPCGIELNVGQVWREVDPRFTREVVVLEIAPKNGDVRTRNVAHGGRGRWSKLSRFHGKRGGYAFVKESA